MSMVIKRAITIQPFIIREPDNSLSGCTGFMYRKKSKLAMSNSIRRAVIKWEMPSRMMNLEMAVKSIVCTTVATTQRISMKLYTGDSPASSTGANILMPRKRNIPRKRWVTEKEYKFPTKLFIYNTIEV